jgi:mRNA interferase RelE/StbE
LRAIRDWRLKDALQAAIEALMDEPRPPGCRKLVGRAGQWRIRVGTWRVVYRIGDGRLVVMVVRIGPRGEGALQPVTLANRPEMPKRMYGCNTDVIRIEYGLNTGKIQRFPPVAPLLAAKSPRPRNAALTRR